MALRRILLFPLILGMLLVPHGVQGATQLGIRGGYSHATGDVFEGSGDVGGGGLYGVVASIGLFSMVDVEFAYERYTTDFELDAGVFEDVLLGDEVSYEDQAYIFTGLVNLSPGGNPLGFYGGGGFSIHEIRLENFEEIPDEIDPERSDWEWHLVGGVGLRLGSLPLRGYAEYRYQNVQGDDSPTYSSVYAGLNLFLD
jgi:hypothetical protein